MAMLLDHFNTLFLNPVRPELYAVGRMAFPLFCLVWAINVLRKPENLQQSANRLWMWSISTQPIFTLAFQHQNPWYALNILFVFAVATQLLAWIKRFGKKGMFYGGTILLVSLPFLTPASYGLQGLVLAISLAIWLSPERSRVNIIPEALIMVALITLNGFSHIITRPADTLLFALLPTVLLPLATITLTRNLALKSSERFMPRHFFYVSYAGHLLCYAGLLMVI